MKGLKKLVVILFAALMMMAVLETQVKAASTYDEYERGKLRDFFEQDSYVAGKKNGEMINPDNYDSENPETWTGVEWYEGHVVTIGTTSGWHSSYLMGSLDVCNFTKLEEIFISSNRITSLKVKDATSLSTLLCYYNEITDLDVSNLPNLSNLDCCSNQITKLDLTNSTNCLERVCCGNNQLTSIIFSSAPYMKELYCAYNNLSSLDVSNISNLKTLECYNNQLSRLDVSELGGLTSFNCADNHLTEIKANFRERPYRLTSNGNGYVEMYISFEAYSIDIDTLGIDDEYSPIQGDVEEAADSDDFTNWTYASDPTKEYSDNEFIYLDYSNGCDLVANFTGSPTPQKYIVKFDLKGGSRKGGGELTQLVEPGGSAIAPELYEREGYQFIAWDAALDNITRNITISAIWAPKQVVINHVVHFDLNGGTHTGGGYLLQNVLDGGWAIEPTTTREGYIFKGWDTSFAEVKSDLDIKALWEEITFTVTFDTAGGTRTGAGELVQKVKPNSAASAPELTRESYTFKGWDKAFDNITEDITVTAQWEEVPPVVEETFTITYDPNGGEGEVPVDEQEYQSGDIATLVEEPELTLEGYIFAGWSLEEDGELVDYTELEVFDDMIFYAVWEEIVEEATSPEPEAPDTPDLPDTGESFNPSPMIIISITALLMTAAVLIRRRSLQKSDQD